MGKQKRNGSANKATDRVVYSEFGTSASAIERAVHSEASLAAISALLT